jgi:hypothetical protein
MHNAQAFGQVCGLSEHRCSCLHRVCAKLAATATPGHDHKPKNHVQSQQVCELMACSCNYLQTSVLLLPAQGLMLHAQGWRSLLLSACTGFVQRLYMYTANYTLHGLQDHPSEVMGMWRLSNKSVSSLYAGVVACRPVCCCYMHVCSVQHWVIGTPSTVPQQNSVDVVELVLSGLRSACCAAVRTHLNMLHGAQGCAAHAPR